MRPELDKTTDPDEFLNYYWLKEELLSFCRKHNLPGSGSKGELTERIYEYLRPGNRKPEMNTPLSTDSRISKGYKNDERHRAFFRAAIGVHFKFNVPFMNWMKENAGKSYADAIVEWKRIAEEKKQGKKRVIPAQFQYNQYTRDFFTANPDAKRDDAITCWKYKKALPGHNRYEGSDLAAIGRFSYLDKASAEKAIRKYS